MQYDEQPIQSDPRLDAIARTVDYTDTSLDFRPAQKAYLLEITSVGCVVLKRDNDGSEVAQFHIRCQIIEPSENAGRRFTERLFTGTDSDPLAERRETWENPETINMQNIARLCKWNGIKNPIDLKGVRFCAFVQHQEDERYFKLINYGIPGSIVPGEDTPVRNFGANRPKPQTNSRNAPPVAQSMAAAESQCVSCREYFPQAEIAQHQAGCTGPALNV